MEATAIPAELLRRYQVVLYPRSSVPERRMRQVDSRYIGGLVSVKGIVTQVRVVPLAFCPPEEAEGMGSERLKSWRSKSASP